MSNSPSTKERLQNQSVSTWGMVLSSIPIIVSIVVGVATIYTRMAVSDNKFETHIVQADRIHLQMQDKIDKQDQRYQELHNITLNIQGDLKVIKSLLTRIDRR